MRSFFSSRFSTTGRLPIPNKAFSERSGRDLPQNIIFDFSTLTVVDKTTHSWANSTLFTGMHISRQKKDRAGPDICINITTNEVDNQCHGTSAKAKRKTWDTKKKLILHPCKASTTETATVVANIVYTDDDTDTERDQKGAERNGITLCIVLRW